MLLRCMAKYSWTGNTKRDRLYDRLCVSIDREKAKRIKQRIMQPTLTVVVKTTHQIAKRRRSWEKNCIFGMVFTKYQLDIIKWYFDIIDRSYRVFQFVHVYFFLLVREYLFEVNYVFEVKIICIYFNVFNYRYSLMKCRNFQILK